MRRRAFTLSMLNVCKQVVVVSGIDVGSDMDGCNGEYIGYKVGRGEWKKFDTHGQRDLKGEPFVCFIRWSQVGERQDPNPNGWHLEYQNPNEWHLQNRIPGTYEKKYYVIPEYSWKIMTTRHQKSRTTDDIFFALEAGSSSVPYEMAGSSKDPHKPHTWVYGSRTMGSKNGAISNVKVEIKRM